MKKQNKVTCKKNNMIVDLPFITLEPYMSNEQLYIHYEIHHKNYDNNLKKLLNKSSYDLDEVIKNSPKNSAIYNNAAQVFNHNLFWHSIKLNTFCQKKYEKYYSLVTELRNQALALFGSGWVFVIKKDLSVVSTSNALIPDNKPLLCLDVWEHSYYIDYRYDRREFIEVFIYHLMNWELLP